MNYINIHTSTLDSPQFLGSDPVERGTWLCLLRYCVGQENGGTIRDCATWNDRQWQQVVGVTKAEIERRCALWKREVGHLKVWAYPINNERSYLAMRKGAKRGNAKRWKIRPLPAPRIAENGS